MDEASRITSKGTVVQSSALPTGAATSANQTNGSQLVQLIDPTNTARRAGFDEVFLAQLFIDIEHHELHEGDVHTFCEVIALGNGASQDYLITTPDTAKWAHFGYNVDFNDGAGTIQMYEATDKTGTTLQNVYNRNRNSVKTATTTVRKGTSGGTTDGTLLCARRAGSGKTLSGSAGSGQERVLKQNTKHIIRITNNTNVTNNTSVEFTWYEHTSE